jgi:hypothetical protein
MIEQHLVSYGLDGWNLGSAGNNLFRGQGEGCGVKPGRRIVGACDRRGESNDRQQTREAQRECPHDPNSRQPIRIAQKEMSLILTLVDHGCKARK